MAGLTTVVPPVFPCRSALVLALVLVSGSAHAGSRQIEGRLTAVDQNYRSFKAEALDDKAKSKTSTATTEVAEMQRPLNNACVITLDGRLVRPAVALVPGRWFYLYETGTLYIIAGTGGRAVSPGNQNEPLTAFRLGKDGMPLIEIEGDRLPGQFIGIDGTAHDVFHIRKTVL
jgi:hypothetical protein